jgi:hypothetical protein
MAFGRSSFRRTWRRRRRRSYGGYSRPAAPSVVYVGGGGGYRRRRRFRGVNVHRTAAYRRLSTKLRSARRRAGSAVLRVGRYQFTMAGIAGIAALGGLAYWMYNNKEKTGKWL